MYMGIFSAIKSFVIRNFWMPLTGEASGYNIFNTTFYAAGFALSAAYLGYPFLKKLNISLDRRFFMGIAPYILLGGAVRVLEDRAIADSFLFVTPFIYIIMFFLTVSLLVAAVKIFDEEYHRYFGATGAVLFLLTVSLYGFKNLLAVPILLVVFGVSALSIYLGTKFLKPELLSYSFMIPVLAHYWDASTTVTALRFGAKEKHVLAGFFIDLMGPAGMFAMKSLVIIPAVYYIDQEMEGEKKLYYLFLIAMLGLALGTRNILSIMSI